MNEQTLNSFAQELRRQRAVLLGEVASTEADLENLSLDREGEWNESAQKEHIAHDLGRLDVRDTEALTDVEAALQRITAGTYGTCEKCGKTIALERLNAIPTARFCAACEQAIEALSSTEEEEVPNSGRVPPDLSLLGDEELREAIYEQVREDGRVDMEELQITCRNGVVILEGALPSERERSILSQLITDVMGFEEIVDHIRVEELAWQRVDHFKPHDLLPEKRSPEAELYGSDDDIESAEEVLREAPLSGHPAPEQE